MRSKLYAVSQRRVAIVSGILVCAAAALDVLTGLEMHVYAVYFIPVSLAAWFGSRALWLLVAAGSAVASEIAFKVMGGRFSQSRYLAGNLIMEVVTYAFIGALTAHLRKKNRQDVWRLQHDALTGLLNREGLRRRLEDDVRIVARYRRSLTLAYLDLDNFKFVNDAHGHQAGDEVLGHAARVIRHCLRETDAAARMGGDEFALVLPETNANGAKAMLERVRTAVEAEMSGMDYPVTASIGALTFDEVPPDIDMMISRADQQMYLVKHSGKNRTVVIDIGEGRRHPSRC